MQLFLRSKRSRRSNHKHLVRLFLHAQGLMRSRRCETICLSLAYGSLNRLLLRVPPIRKVLRCSARVEMNDIKHLPNPIQDWPLEGREVYSWLCWPGTIFAFGTLGTCAMFGTCLASDCSEHLAQISQCLTKITQNHKKATC